MQKLTKQNDRIIDFANTKGKKTQEHKTKRNTKGNTLFERMRSNNCQARAQTRTSGLDRSGANLVSGDSKNSAKLKPPEKIF